MNIYEEVKKALKQKGAKGDLSKTSSFKDLGIDSLDLMDMVVELEEKTQIVIPDDVLLEIQTIGELVNIVENLKNGKQ